MSTFAARLHTQLAGGSHLCVGIDPHPWLLADWGLADTPENLAFFGRSMIESALTGGAAAVKLQSALFERHGSKGIAALEAVLAFARQVGMLTILDVKRGDIGSTMRGYAEAYLADDSPLAADAITLSPYLGFGSLAPALELAAENGRGVFVLAFTSNPEGASVQRAVTVGGIQVGESIIQAVSQANAGALPMGGVGVVIGATIGSLPPAGAQMISQVGGPILAPGLGVQGGQPADLRRVFGPARNLVLATASRALAGAGPDPERVVAAVRQTVANLSFLGI
ncbi:MAG: orotidine-5'-phosphate decarboxylase [Bifidobacteriaceae bacterium]|jgi:orotidine-5'-phosphate decarboxylase|nr:orotidine-5'-phosphate decarboxylase [Bifidobacteriaceae bacterium]